ncbi:hypothetical protein CHARACLAT_024409 [Characodon lateralis]|uniref:Uncharacterized protein n=1 Tax=Characodon lateralis TaxID=208331 RepID=A0ABU7EQ58_9TELE|nr:hypothetical protein [Characodon lateralis]
MSICCQDDAGTEGLWVSCNRLFFFNTGSSCRDSRGGGGMRLSSALFSMRAERLQEEFSSRSVLSDSKTGSQWLGFGDTAEEPTPGTKAHHTEPETVTGKNLYLPFLGGTVSFFNPLVSQWA